MGDMEGDSLGSFDIRLVHVCLAEPVHVMLTPKTKQTGMDLEGLRTAGLKYYLYLCE